MDFFTGSYIFVPEGIHDRRALENSPYIFSILNSSIYDLNFVCAWCRAGGLCVFAITISSLPSSKLNTSASNFKQFLSFVWGSVKVQLCSYLNLDSLRPTRNCFSKYQHHPSLIQRFVLKTFDLCYNFYFWREAYLHLINLTPEIGTLWRTDLIGSRSSKKYFSGERFASMP